MLIRQQQPRGRLPPPETLPKRDPSFDIRHVRDKVSKTKHAPWLADRLGQYIAERRGYIQYRQEHQERVGELPKNDPEKASNVAELAPSTIAISSENAAESSDHPINELKNSTIFSIETDAKRGGPYLLLSPEGVKVKGP